MIEASVVIPSYRRPELLARALRGCLAQRGVDFTFEIVVVDNDPAASAGAGRRRNRRRGIGADPLRRAKSDRGSLMPAIPASPPRPSATSSFSTTMRSRRPIGSPPLSRRSAGAMPISSSVRSIPGFRSATPIPIAAANTRAMPVSRPAARLAHWAGIGNTILDKSRCFSRPEPFDPRRWGLTGGEDTMFLHQLLRAGRKLVWCAEAAVYETVPADRLDAGKYLLRRAFRGSRGRHSSAR